MISKSLNEITNIFMLWWEEITLLFVTITILSYIFVKHKYTYWERHGIPALRASIPFGCFGNVLRGKINIGRLLKDLYKKGQGHKYIGYYSFWTPTLLVRDPELIKRILVKDFEYFCDRGMYYNENEDPLSVHLFAMNGLRWKNTRQKLNHAFTSGQIKHIYITMKTCCSQLQNVLTHAINNNEEIDFRELFSKHSLNVIANTTLGVEGHTLENESILSDIAFKATAPTIIQNLRFSVAMLAKDVASLIRMRITPKDVERFYMDMTKEIVEKRRNNDVVHDDFMQILFNMWDRNLNYDSQTVLDEPDKLSLRDLAAQAYLFILAAYETSSSLLSFTLYELARNQKLQDSLIAEIDTLGPLEGVTYEQVMSLKYIDMVLNETLRMYPPSGMLFRECQKPYKLPNGEILEKGITVAMSIFGVQNDPEYFPDPGKYDPDRFDKDNPAYNIIPYTFLAFGEGPRFCIGKRYAQVNSRITLISLLSKFRFELSEKTADPIVIDPKVFITQSRGGLILKVTIRK